MTYDFDRIIDRRHTAAYKWDIGENELPMWVADMDFATAPEILDAIKNRVENGVFGYSYLPDEWYDAYIGWWDRRHGIKYEKEDLVFATGVVPILSSCVRKLTTENENVVLMTPVYNCFFSSVINSGRRVLEAPLRFDGDGGCFIDFGKLENALADPQTSLLFLCNPHNPTGRIWTEEELSEVGRLCLKHGVTVISDEIHCDLTDPGKEYVPFLRAAPECAGMTVTCLAPTKTFNIAGLQTACAAVRGKRLRHRVWRALNTDEVGEPNAFAVAATVAAFTRGEKWLDELRR
ncbi:MAG: aminotransferase class I/II-fold pyridoxal phosphate-dependent enzyme, partial [Clostridia bacterium]|nr:aminotransferase class I/II-fold pyridoxal phosphate-dependent enzyme [Clostridia bacterium]